MEHEVLKEQMNKAYYESICKAWAYFAIKNYYYSFDSDEDDYEFAFRMLCYHGQVVYHEFKEAFEDIWLCFFKSVDCIPSEIKEDFICENCSENCENCADDIEEEYPF